MEVEPIRPFCLIFYHLVQSSTIAPIFAHGAVLGEYSHADMDRPKKRLSLKCCSFQSNFRSCSAILHLTTFVGSF